MQEENYKLIKRRYEKLKIQYDEFEEAYPKRVKGGLLAIVIIPIFFMILMFSMESKLLFLSLWIVSILAIAGYLIYLEYVHYKYKEQFEEDTNEEADNEKHR